LVLQLLLLLLLHTLQLLHQPLQIQCAILINTATIVQCLLQLQELQQQLELPLCGGHLPCCMTPTCACRCCSLYVLQGRRSRAGR
jgi:hypothetical protein